MALFYNILTLERETKNNPLYLVTALEHYYNKRILSINQYEKYPPIKKPLYGSSFLANPKDFFADKKTDILHRAQYLRLSGRRDYSIYKLYGIKYLDLSFLPEVPISSISANPLLTINKNLVYFKYEEK